MQKPDAYYGDVADRYDASREVKPKWRNELSAIERFLTDGPVLDAPLGTGRFVPVYRSKSLEFVGVDISADMLAIAKGKFPGIDARQGTILDLTFADGAFATAVCVRFLEWLPLDQAAFVLAKFRRIASTLIMTINHGIESHPEAYTYDLGKFLAAIDGLFIEGRMVTACVKGITSEMFKLRPARWADVVDQFRHDHGDEAEANIQRIADKHAGFFGLSLRPITQETTSVRAEYWNGRKIGAIVDVLADHRFIVDKSPRSENAPITVIRRDGVDLIIDGRHRANIWMETAGPHPVLVITC